MNKLKSGRPSRDLELSGCRGADMKGSLLMALRNVIAISAEMNDRTVLSAKCGVADEAHVVHLRVYAEHPQPGLPWC
jgi:hypothetical protein